MQTTFSGTFKIRDNRACLRLAYREKKFFFSPQNTQYSMYCRLKPGLDGVLVFYGEDRFIHPEELRMGTLAHNQKH